MGFAGRLIQSLRASAGDIVFGMEDGTVSARQCGGCGKERRQRASPFGLKGQFISTLLIGLLSALATWAIGLPSPFALGFIAGITEFIPYVGPLLAAVPAILVASTLGLQPPLDGALLTRPFIRWRAISSLRSSNGRWFTFRLQS